MIYKLDSDSLKAFSAIFLKSLVENVNVIELLQKLELSVVEDKGDAVVGYLNVLNPPTNIKFDDLDDTNADI